MLSFPPFQLDIENERLWKKGEEKPLRRKPFAILRYLAENPQRLVRHEELVNVVWGPKCAMSASLLRTHLCDLRQVLGEGVVETVGGRGYRFLPEVRLDLAPRRSEATAMVTARGAVVVGRDAELGSLHEALEAAKARRRTTVFVSGEAGMGKTALVDAFLERATATDSLLVGWGTCLEQYGSGEEYLPVLEAVGALCRGPGASRVIDVLSAHAPAWLVRLPGVVRPDRRDDLQRRAAGATPASTVCELADALAVLSQQAPVVLVFDDLQWSDPSTAMLINFLSRRREPAQILIVGTYRPSEGSRDQAATRVARELIAHRHASAIEVLGLSSDAVDGYLSTRFRGHDLSADLAPALQRATSGNPLLLATLVDSFEREGLHRRRMGRREIAIVVSDLAAGSLDGLRHLVDAQVAVFGDAPSEGALVREAATPRSRAA
jgi:DNA-binding winged helix-turn-helix (wHTH) protein